MTSSSSEYFDANELDFLFNFSGQAPTSTMTSPPELADDDESSESFESDFQEADDEYVFRPSGRIVLTSTGAIIGYHLYHLDRDSNSNSTLSEQQIVRDIKEKDLENQIEHLGRTWPRQQFLQQYLCAGLADVKAKSANAAYLLSVEVRSVFVSPLPYPFVEVQLPLPTHMYSVSSSVICSIPQGDLSDLSSFDQKAI